MISALRSRKKNARSSLDMGSDFQGATRLYSPWWSSHKAIKCWSRNRKNAHYYSMWYVSSILRTRSRDRRLVFFLDYWKTGIEPTGEAAGNGGSNVIWRKLNTQLINVAWHTGCSFDFLRLFWLNFAPFSGFGIHNEVNGSVFSKYSKDLPESWGNRIFIF